MCAQTHKKRVLVTAALPYSNGRPHVGHIAGAYLPADIYVRYLRLSGVETRFICGSDDHGVAIMITAEKEGKTPREVAAYYNRKQREAFKGLGIIFDVYGSTCENKFHTQASQGFFLKLFEKGFFEKQRTRQFYDESRQMFLPDRYVRGSCGYCNASDQYGDQCEQCGKMLDVESLREAVSVVSGTPAVVRETVHWFIDLSRFEDEVGSWLESAAVREQTKSYVRGLLGSGFVKRSMTRDIPWGIPLPIDDPEAKGKVLYVWFDAPIGYVSNTMELCAERDGDSERYSEWWKSDDCEFLHFIGEDNTIFHCVIWIAMLRAEGTFHLPRGVIVNQFLNFQQAGKEVEKISKSRGTAVWIEDYLAEGGNPDSLRYYLTLIAPEKARTVYRPEDLIQRHNSELANVLGNFVNRILSFTHKYVGPHVPEYPAGLVQDVDRAFIELLINGHQTVTDQLEQFSFKGALETVMECARACNKYVDDKAPWTTRKTDMELTKVTLAHAIQGIKFLAVTLSPFLPFAAERIATMLSLDSSSLRWSDATELLPGGAPLGAPEILFSKIEAV